MKRTDYPDYRPEGHGPGVVALIQALTAVGYSPEMIETLLEWVREDFRDEIRALRVFPPASEEDRKRRNAAMERVIGKLNIPKGVDRVG